MSSKYTPTYYPPGLDNIENLEKYRKGGFHPVSIGDTFADGRYRVLHKLGFGGTSTVWLVQDQDPSKQPQYLGHLVALKIMLANESSESGTDIADFFIPKEVDNTGLPGRGNLLTASDHFLHEGPNGTHLCLIYRLAGPKVTSGVFHGAERVRMRGDLARRVAYQVANAVRLLHCAGIVHGDLTTSNIVFALSESFSHKSFDDVQKFFGDLKMAPVLLIDKSSPPSSSPRHVVEPVDYTRFISNSLIKEDILLIDFAQSFYADKIPTGYQPVITYNFCSPEGFFDLQRGFPSDIWALACTLFEIRAGFPLFYSFFGGYTEVLKQMVLTLGKLPEPWWSSWEEREKWFDQAGDLKPTVASGRRVKYTPTKTPLEDKLRIIPAVPSGCAKPPASARLDEAEIELLVDLLSKMLQYRPEDRISILEVVEHPWFRYSTG